MKLTEQHIADGLYRLTKELANLGYSAPSGLLGGEYGYGAYIDTDVFMMHPFCWCEEEECSWCNETEEEPNGAPNFYHKKSGLKVWWYKYIGRSMEWEGEAKITPKQFEKILEECIEAAKNLGV